jgi:hypothetical protein
MRSWEGTANICEARRHMVLPQAGPAWCMGALSKPSEVSGAAGGGAGGGSSELRACESLIR